MALTSSAGRFQFSVENAYTVRYCHAQLLAVSGDIPEHFRPRLMSGSTRQRPLLRPNDRCRP